MEQGYIVYYRVSTQKQHKSGLGLEAQRESVRQYFQTYGGYAIYEYQDIQSGKAPIRETFDRAVDHAKLTNSVLLVARLDRLSRDLHFITGLQKRGIAFKLCDFPQIDQLTLHILAATAEHEAKLIAQRTKSALEMAKRRGTKLGNPSLDIYRNTNVQTANQKRQEKQKEYREQLLNIITQLDPKSEASDLTLATHLTRQGMKSIRGQTITARMVNRIRKGEI